MENREERKLTSIKISFDEKVNLMRYFGTTNFSKIIRKILNGLPVILDKDAKRSLLKCGVQHFSRADRVKRCVNQALDFAAARGFQYEEEESPHKEELERIADKIDVNKIFQK